MSRAPNPARGEASIRLGGRDYVLRPTFDALCQIEVELDAPILDLAEQVASGDYGARQTAIIVLRCAQAVPHNPPLDAVTAGKLVARLGVREAGRITSALLLGALTVDDPDLDAEPAPDGPRDGRLPWERFQETAGAMRWTPDQFWAATPREFVRFVRGFGQSRGGKGGGSARRAAVGSRAEFMAEFEEMKKRFPDGG